MLFHYLIFLLATCNCAPDYVKSIFGHPGTDEVENEFVDGFEILERNLPKPSKKHIKEANFSSEVIDENDYPWPGHKLNGDKAWNLTQEEGKAIRSFYNDKVDLMEDDIYWHPAASRNIYTTDEILDNAERVKIKVVMRPQYRQHYLPAIFPPGELVTVEILESSINKVVINTNTQTRDIDGKRGEATNYNQRLPYLTISTKLTQKVNKVGNPYGGPVSFGLTGSDPIEMIISNVILMPSFIYGYTSDDDWKYQMENYKGSFVFLDTGNLINIGPKRHVTKEPVRMNDIQHYWRSAIQIAQTTARDYKLNHNPRFGRVVNPCHLKYDIFVPAGAAVAFGAANFVHCPLDWFNTVNDWDSTIQLPWGTLHEINHNRQENFGGSQPNNGEMTNNMINLQVIAKTNTASALRKGDVWYSYTYASHFLNKPNQNDGLPRYSTLVHFFGVEKFKDFIKADQEDEYFTNDEYGIIGAEMLRASKIFNRNMRYHWNFHSSSDADLTKKNSNTLNVLEEMNLKPFHPVTNIYAVGNVVDGKEFYTARPYQLNPWKQIINFTSQMVQRENKEQFGDFEFSSAVFEDGRESAWIEQSKGAYLVTPKEELNETEEVRVNYLDKTTNEIHTVICQFTTMFVNKNTKQTIYGHIPDTENDIFKSYRYIVHNATEENIIESKYMEFDLYQSHYNNNQKGRLFSIREGLLSPPETADYIFSITSKQSALFYISEEPLKGDPDLDSEHLTNYLPSNQMSFDSGNKSKEIHLEKDKYYYFRYVVFPQNKFTLQGYVGYKKVGSSNGITTVPSSWLRFNEISNKYFWDNQFKPDFERIYLMDEWDQLIKNDQSKWKLNKSPKGGVISHTNEGQGQGGNGLTPIESLTDGDDTTDFRANWWNGQLTPFPHIYEIDMGETQQFDTIKLKGSGNYEWFGMHSYLKVYLGTDNYDVADSESVSCTPENCSINHESSLIWDGIYDTQMTQFIEFKKILTGRYLKFIFVNNSRKWKDGNPSRTDISTIEVGFMPNNKKIYPMTNTRYITKTNRWDETHSGSYYNGKGYTGYAANTAPHVDNDNSNKENSIMTVRIPKLKPEIGIIGDYYPTMGTAVIKIDGKEVGKIHDSFDVEGDKRRLKRASRSHLSLLFYYKELDPEKEHTLTIEVTEGQITLAGLLTHQMVVKYHTDDYRYPKILETEFNEKPEQFDWYKSTEEIGPYIPTPKPTPSIPPTITPKETPTMTPKETPTPSTLPKETPTPEIEHTSETDSEIISEHTSETVSEIISEHTSETDSENVPEHTSETVYVSEQTSKPEDVDPTEAPLFPFKTPEPLEIQEVAVKENGIIETEGFDQSKNKEYSAKVSTDKVEIHGNGHVNFYLSVGEKVDVKETEAQFGIKLESKEQSTTVVLHQEKANMNIKGSGTVKIETSSDTDKPVTINDVFVSNKEEINIHPDSKFSSLELNNLNMYGDSVFNSQNKHVKSNLITVFEGATAKISNVEVHNKVTVELNAVMSISNVDLSNVEQMVLSYHHSLLSSKAPITGKLEKPPKQISLKQQEKTVRVNSLDDKNEFIIASTEKDDFPQCNDWINVVPLSGTPFEKVECRNVNNLRELVAFSEKEPEKEQEENKKNVTPIIIGVVVAVIVVIVVIVIVVVVINKKKRRIHSSDVQINSTVNNENDYDI